MAADEARQTRQEERLVRVEEKVNVLHDDLLEVKLAINGPPREESVRGRLHRLESNEAAAKAAEAALTAARALHDERSEKKFTKLDKVIGGLIAFAVLASQWLAPLLYHSPHS